MGYSTKEWDEIGLHNDYELVTAMLNVLYVIGLSGVNIGEGKQLVWLCRDGDDYWCDMVVESKVG